MALAQIRENRQHVRKFVWWVRDRSALTPQKVAAASARSRWIRIACFGMGWRATFVRFVVPGEKQSSFSCQIDQQKGGDVMVCGREWFLHPDRCQREGQLRTSQQFCLTKPIFSLLHCT